MSCDLAGNCLKPADLATAPEQVDQQPGNAGASDQLAGQLTKNQKKKRRQKLAKKGKRAESQTLYGEDSHQGFLSSAACAASESELSSAIQEHFGLTQHGYNLPQQQPLLGQLPATQRCVLSGSLSQPQALMCVKLDAAASQTASCSEDTMTLAAIPLHGGPLSHPHITFPPTALASSGACLEVYEADSSSSFHLAPAAAGACPPAHLQAATVSAQLAATTRQGSHALVAVSTLSSHAALLAPGTVACIQIQAQQVCSSTPTHRAAALGGKRPNSRGPLCRQDLSAAAAIIAAGLHSSGPAETPVEPRVASNIARPVSSGNPEGSDCEDQLNSDGSRAGGHAAPDAAADLGHETGDAAPPAKRQRQVYLHGNYHRYYGYRLGSAFEEDPRLQVLDKRWFQGRRCLDIGCNEGVVTLSVVQRFGCFSMLGVDIDEALVKKACRRLQTVRSEAASRQEHLRRHYPASAEAETLQGLGAQPSPAAQRKAAATAVRALGCTWFQCEDFVAAEHSAQSVDTVLCLSVTKWVHLNRGDEGLRSLFQKVRDVLTPGGFFVLEPQPWRSYKQAMRKQGVSAAPHSQLDQLHFRPEAFMEYLVQELTFKLVRSPEVAESAPGFDRPMYVFKKVLQGSP